MGTYDPRSRKGHFHNNKRADDPMTNTPLTSNDYGKLLVFGLLLLPAIGFLVGVVPTLFLAFGIFMMKKTRDFSHIETSARYFQWYCWLVFAALMATVAYHFMDWETSQSSWKTKTFFESRNAEDALMAAAFSIIPIAYVLFSDALFLNPLRSHRDWLTEKGIFGAGPGVAVPAPINIDIIKGERLKSFSVADELLKWAKLLDDGLVSQEEFNEVRKKLLQRS